ESSFAGERFSSSIKLWVSLCADGNRSKAIASFAHPKMVRVKVTNIGIRKIPVKKSRCGEIAQITHQIALSRAAHPFNQDDSNPFAVHLSGP
ncbi:MAG TPA: hypothetical protein DIU35_05180, partial [Candidatus Latescibacteria bacterium]|nr:hypothetical protein [Candidatus Latescibacterota bacterium]